MALGIVVQLKDNGSKCILTVAAKVFGVAYV